MRDTSRYPVTVDEMIEACSRSAADILKRWEADPTNMPVGDLTPMALQEAAKRLERMQFALWDGKPKRKRA